MKKSLKRLGCLVALIGMLLLVAPVAIWLDLTWEKARHEIG